MVTPCRYFIHLCGVQILKLKSNFWVVDNGEDNDDDDDDDDNTKDDLD